MLTQLINEESLTLGTPDWEMVRMYTPDPEPEPEDDGGSADDDGHVKPVEPRDDSEE